jgi:hypothetical protein
MRSSRLEIAAALGLLPVVLAGCGPRLTDADCRGLPA